MKINRTPHASKKRLVILIVVATAGLLAIGLLLRQETAPPNSTQNDKRLLVAPVKIPQSNPSPSITGTTALAPQLPTKPLYPNAKSLDLIPPTPPNKDQYLRILVEQVLGINLPQELRFKVGYPEIGMQPAEAQRLIDDLASLSRSGFKIPGVIETLGNPYKSIIYPEKGYEFDSKGFARITIRLEAGGSVFRGHPYDPGDKWVLEVNPSTGVVYLTFYPGVLRDDQ